MGYRANELPIGIFDSGVGGLTVYRALHEALPDEHVVYWGDTGRVPYGTKSLATVERYAVENARFLAAHRVELLVVACNTASALALPAVRRAVGCEVVGVIGPGARAAATTSASGRIGVIATEATVSSQAYAQAIAHVRASAQVYETACPLFVALAEEGWAESDVARHVAREYLAGIAAKEVDTLVLGCTHYPLLRGVIQECVGPAVQLIDSGAATAAEVVQLLQAKDLARPATLPVRRERVLGDDLDHFYVTDAAARFSRVAARFLGRAPAVLEAVEVWGQDELSKN